MAISESEQRFRTLAEGIDVLIALGDEKGAATYFNTAWVKATGRSVRELLKSGWVDIIHPEDKQQVFSALRSALEKTAPFSCEFRLANPSGKHVW